MMTTPSEKLAASLEVLKTIQDQGVVAIQARQISRVHKGRLIKNGFLEEVIKGWYIPTRPDETAGESTSWYASFWRFCAAYLNNRFQQDWCLSAEQSLLIHAENWTVPKQLLVRSSKGNNKITRLPHETSLLDARYTMPAAESIEEKNGMRVFSIPAGLIAASSSFFVKYPIEARAVLASIKDISGLLRLLLSEGHSAIAGRLCGAFRNLGETEFANDIKKTMLAAGYDVRESDPFTTETPRCFDMLQRSPHVNRMNMLWAEMRQQVIHTFPSSPGISTHIDQYLKQVDKNYINDAYHSLSIEGYQVSLDLIEKVRRGDWNPDSIDHDRHHKNALAARGYWLAFNAVKTSIHSVLSGTNPGEVVKKEHADWYRAMFQPSVMAGILKPADLAGYRNGFVYIRRSMHVPPRFEALGELMSAFFQLMCEEKESSVRVVLGHFFLVYIHPYFDGNGRMGRFLMNVMLASGGYPWTIVPVERRSEYMAALEAASVNQDIMPFCKFLASCVYEKEV